MHEGLLYIRKFATKTSGQTQGLSDATIERFCEIDRICRKRLMRRFPIWIL